MRGTRVSEPAPANEPVAIEKITPVVDESLGLMQSNLALDKFPSSSLPHDAARPSSEPRYCNVGLELSIA
jgi:hypothetical protein